MRQNNKSETRHYRDVDEDTLKVPKRNIVIKCSTSGCNNNATWWVDDNKPFCTYCYQEKYRQKNIFAEQLQPGPSETK